MLFVVLDNSIITVGALEQGNKECFSIIHSEEPINNLFPKRLSRYKYHIKYLHKASDLKEEVCRARAVQLKSRHFV